LPSTLPGIIFPVEATPNEDVVVVWVGAIARGCVALVALSFIPVASVSAGVRIEWIAPAYEPGDAPGLPAHPMAVDALGNVVVAAIANDAGQWSYRTTKFGPDGTRKWRVIAGGATDAFAQAVAVDAAGNVYVTGRSLRPGGTDYLTIKYAPEGTELWRRTAAAGPLLAASPAAMAVDPLGNVYVTGSTGGPLFGEIFTVKYDGAGTELWGVLTDRGSSLGETARAIAVDAGGNVYIAGASTYAYDPGEFFASTTSLIVKYEPSGVLAWKRTYGGEVAGSVGVAVDGMGDIYVVANDSRGGSSVLHMPDIVLSKLDPAGGVHWRRRATSTAGAPPFEDGSEAAALALDALGNAYINGMFRRWPTSAYSPALLTLAYDAAGVERWRKTYPSSVGTAIVLDPGGNAIAAGYDASAAAIIKYGPGGAELWKISGTGAGGASTLKSASTLAPGPDGALYVGGAGYDPERPLGLVIQKLVEVADAPAVSQVPAPRGALLVLLGLAVAGLGWRTGARRR